MDTYGLNSPVFLRWRRKIPEGYDTLALAGVYWIQDDLGNQTGEVGVLWGPVSGELPYFPSKQLLLLDLWWSKPVPPQRTLTSQIQRFSLYILKVCLVKVSTLGPGVHARPMLSPRSARGRGGQAWTMMGQTPTVPRNVKIQEPVNIDYRSRVVVGLIP